MAGRLTAPWRPRRVAGAALVLLFVLALHLFVTRQIAQSLDDFVRAGEMPERIQVTYVRELELAAPPAAAPVVVAAPAPKPTAAAKPAAAPASTPASAPLPTADDEAALRERALAWAAAQAASQAASMPAAPAEESAATSPPASAPDASAVAAASPASAASDAAALAFDWPVSTRLTYALSGNYRGEVLGDAQVEWVRVGTHYQVHIDIGVGARFAPIISRRMSSEGELVGDSLRPSRYDEDTRVLLRPPRRVTILLGPDEIALPNGVRLPRPGIAQQSSIHSEPPCDFNCSRPPRLSLDHPVGR